MVFAKVFATRFRWIPAFGLAVLATGFVFQKLGLRKDRRRYPPPGRFVRTPAGTFHVHQSTRSAGPSVILESGLAGSSIGWSLILAPVGDFASVYSYDRAGFGWSTPIRSPRSLKNVVEELRQLLEIAQIPPPYILVGHSYGGLIVRAFAHLYPQLLAGLVLVDPVSTSQWASCKPNEQQRLLRGARLARRGALLAETGLLRIILNMVIAGSRFVPLVIAEVSAPGASSFLRRLAREIQKLPAPLWPVVRAQWSRPMGFRSIHAYLVSLRENCIAAESQNFRMTVPATILSAATATQAELEERERWISGLPGGRHLQIQECGHWIQIEKAWVVVEAIRQMVAECKTNSPNSSASDSTQVFPPSFT